MSKAGISYNMQIKGMDKLVAGLLERAKMDVVKQIVKHQTAQLQTRSQATDRHRLCSSYWCYKAWHHVIV